MTHAKVVLSRLIPAPPERVFRACTQPDLLALWLGPNAFEICDVDTDVRVGGRFAFRMRGDRGMYAASGVYREVAAGERVVLTWTWTEGPPGEEPDGSETLVTIQLARAAGGTWLTLTHEGLPSQGQADQHQIGWQEALEKLGAVAGKLFEGDHLTASDAEAPPIRDAKHEALAVFLGQWKAEGLSYGGTDQTGEDPRANGVPWVSTHVGRWHTGEFFLVQDEKALPGGQVFDILSVMGVDVATGEYVAHSFENHGFFRCYRVFREGDTWRFNGEHERAAIVFSDNDRKQTITWEWRPDGEWLPLCDRVASRTD